MKIKLLNEPHLEFLSLKGVTLAHLCLHLSKCHIVGNHMSQLILNDVDLVPLACEDCCHVAVGILYLFLTVHWVELWTVNVAFPCQTHFFLF